MPHHRGCAGLIVLLGVLAGPAWASEASELSPDAPVMSAEERVTYVPPRSFLVPTAEGLLLHGGLLAFSKYVTHADYAQVTWHTIWRNLTGGWRLDPDNIWVNFLGHPYHGALYFNAARSSQLTFWESVPFPIVGGFIWEIAGEKQSPSPNDLIMTGLGGIYFGEVFHRVSILLLDGELPPSALDQLGAFLVDPLGSFNRQVFGKPRPRWELPPLPPYDGGFRFGTVYLSPTPGRVPLQVAFGIDLTYGFPGERTEEHWKPFDYFRAGFSVAAPGSVTTDAFLQGILLGPGFGQAESTAGAWGLFGVYDFVSAPKFRLSSIGLGPGIALQHRLTPGLRLRISGALAAVPMGAVGTREDTDRVRPITETNLLYFLGPGGQGLLETELRLGDVAALQLTGRAWQLGFNADASRRERVYALQLAGRSRIVGELELGASVSVFGRHSASSGGLVQHGAIGGVFLEFPFENR